MASINVVIKKGYLLAGVIMATNMFVVNEVKAMKENGVNKKGNITPNDNEALIPVEESNEVYYFKKYENASFLIKGVLYHVLSSENHINLIGGVISSVANNYLKWWDYNPGGYLNLRIGCLGWRSKKLFDIVQVGINLNLGSGVFWLIAGIIDFFIPDKYRENKFLDIMCTSFNVGMIIFINFKSEIRTILSRISQTAVFLLQGFVSVPLAIHISNFSISISPDSIIWMGIGKFLELEIKNMEKKAANKEPINQTRINEENK